MCWGNHNNCIFYDFLKSLSNVNAKKFDEKRERNWKNIKGRWIGNFIKKRNKKDVKLRENII